MKKISKLLLVLVLSIFIFTTNALADTKNEVTLNFNGGVIHDDYVEYDKIANVQLFKGEDLVTDISNNMVIDLNEAEYKFVIEETQDTGSASSVTTPIKLSINNWYYPITTTILEDTKSTFKLDSSTFSGKLDIKFVRARTVVNTKVENVYNDISSKGVIDLSKDYIIDFTKDDELTEGLKSFADLDKTLYYKKVNDSLLVTDNESEAVIKIVGNREENKAILTAANVGTKESEVFKGFHMKYTGSALDYNSTVEGIIYETRYDYYTRCTYDFTFVYKVEDDSPVVTPSTEGEPSIENPKTGDNIMVYMILGIISTISIMVLNIKRKEVNE